MGRHGMTFTKLPPTEVGTEFSCTWIGDKGVMDCDMFIVMEGGYGLFVDRGYELLQEDEIPWKRFNIALFIRRNRV